MNIYFDLLGLWLTYSFKTKLYLNEECTQKRHQKNYYYVLSFIFHGFISEKGCQENDIKKAYFLKVTVFSEASFKLFGSFTS